MYNNHLKKLPESKPLSSSVINPHLQQMNKSKKDYYNPNHSLNVELLKQSINDFPDDEYDIQIHNINGQNEQKKLSNNKKYNISYFQNRQSSQASSFMFNQNPKKFSMNQQQLYQSLGSRNLQKYIKRQSFGKIGQSQIFQEDQNEQHMVNKSKSARNLRNINQKKLKISSEIENFKNGKQFIPVKKEKKSLNQNLQHKVIYQNFRQSDLNFLSDQQFLPQGMYPQALGRKNSSKNNSKKSESIHPVFRQTLEYIDSRRHNIQQNLLGIDAQSRQLSDQSSESSIPLTNIDDKSSYKERYRKYKHKYNNSINVIKQFQKLNETLINDQRQNLHYYQNTIKDLQNLLMVKDKEIDQLNHILINTKNQEENYSQGLCSIDGRQLQMENQKLKKQLQNKNNQINKLKQKFGSILTQSRIGEQKKQGFNQNLQKKYDLLKKQKESFSKKITTLEELNKMYESKLKQKQQRLNKLSQLNSELQQQIIKMKSKRHSDETYDTERSFVQDFSKKNKKENLTFSTQTFSKYPITPSQLKIDSPSQIEKYISCIDQQLQLIRTSIVKDKGDENSKNINSVNQLRKKDLSELDSVSQFQFEDEVQLKLPFKVLQNVVQKLSNFRASMGA